MRKNKTLSFTLALVLILQIFALPFSTTVQAAAKNGLQTVNGKIYYYKQGTMLKNKWKNVNDKKYYFGKNGAAYKGYKKIGKYRYYFDTNCRMVTDKVVKIKGKKYYFMYNGRAPQRAAMVKKKVWKTTSGGRLVKNINSLAKEGKDYKAFKKAAGNARKSFSSPSCKVIGGTDVNYTYDNFMVSTCKYNGKQEILAVIPFDGTNF